MRYLRVHSGEWSERIARWPPALDRTPLEGELVMVDVIGARAGYAFDVARTILLGEAPAAARELLDACAAASDAGALACRAGATVREVLAAAHAVYASAGLAAHARAFAGHGIGIETVESPLLAAASGELELAAGMTLCVEPGIARPGVGGALIEHELVVGERAPRFLCADAVAQLNDHCGRYQGKGAVRARRGSWVNSTQPHSGCSRLPACSRSPS